MDGTARAIWTFMDTRAKAKRAQRPRMSSTVVHWEFTRGDERVSCQVDRDPESGVFAVALVAYKDLQRVSLEKFEAVASALRRHAMLAADLRGSGWKLATYTR